MKNIKQFSKYLHRAELLKKIGHPVRLVLLQGLLDRSSNVTHIQNRLQIPQPTVSSHLAALRSYGIIEGRRSGLEVFYSIKDQWILKILEIL